MNTWTDSVWLTRDKTRPIPAKGDILLTQVTHTGGLDVEGRLRPDASRVTLPVNLDPGTYYITPWTDLYSAVLQDTLAVNVNPDDPNNFQSDNYKARADRRPGAAAGPGRHLGDRPAAGQGRRQHHGQLDGRRTTATASPSRPAGSTPST